MAAVVDIRTAERYTGHGRPRLVLIESPVDRRRVYRRRRILVAVAAVVTLLALVLIGGRALSSPEGRPTAVRIHTVQPDETLWSIARNAAPDRDPRSTIAEVVELNSSAGDPFDAWAPITVGQRIRVPVHR